MFGDKLVGVEVLFQSFPALLDDPRVPDDLVSFVLSGVAEYILLLEHFPEVCPVSYAVAYVLTNFVLLRVTAAATQEPIEERLILLGHFKSPSLSFPTPVFTAYKIIQTVDSVFLGLADRRHLHPRLPHHTPQGRHAPQQFPLWGPRVRAHCGRSSALRIVAPAQSRVFLEIFR